MGGRRENSDTVRGRLLASSGSMDTNYINISNGLKGLIACNIITRPSLELRSAPHMNSEREVAFLASFSRFEKGRSGSQSR
jgi:hypothetical protein